MSWQPIDTVPKDGTHVDLWAKSWRCHSDSFEYRRFTNVSWQERQAIDERGRGFVSKGWTTKADKFWVEICQTMSDHFPENWFPTHWMPLPPPPNTLGTLGETAEQIKAENP